MIWQTNRSQHPHQKTQVDPLGLHLRNSRLTFGDHLIFEDLSLDLLAGQITCLLGPSGVGKSSLLRQIAGLPSDGISNADISSSDRSSLVGALTYMDQRDLLYPWLTVLENICLGPSLRREVIDLDRANRLLNAVGLGKYGNRRPDVLSGGMRQRAALARTLMDNRDIVLMDEPFSSLDALNRLRLQDLAAQLLKNKTVFLITHDPLEAVRLADRIFILDGSPAKLSEPICPKGPKPRPATDRSVHDMVITLLMQLGISGESAL